MTHKHIITSIDNPVISGSLYNLGRSKKCLRKGDVIFRGILKKINNANLTREN